MRSAWIVGIVIGCLLLYAGIMGSAGFSPLLGLAGYSLPVMDEMDSGSPWLTYRADGGVTPSWANGICTLQGGTSGEDTRSSITQASFCLAASGEATWTLQIKMRMVTSGGMWFGLYLPYHIWSVDYRNGGVTFRDSTSASFLLDSNWHVWSFLCTFADTKPGLFNGGESTRTDLYVDSQKIGTGGSTYNTVVTDNYVRLSLDADSGAKVEIDYVYAKAGLITPGGGPPPTTDTGNIDIYCFVGDGTQIPLSSITVTITGPETKTATTGADGHAMFTGVKVGTYNVAGSTYNDKTPTISGLVVSKDATATGTLDYKTGAGGGGEDPITAILNQIKVFIRKIIDNGTFKQLAMGVGGLVTAVSTVMFILPTKRMQPRAPMPMYY